jgi:cyclic beta-1,2-glucan synthetase
MKLTIETAHDLISNMRSLFLNATEPNYVSEEPLREELFSADQMSAYGQKLAKTHKLTKTSQQGQLLDRLADNEKVLNAVRKLLVAAIKKNGIIAPAGEWLIDNFYLIEEQIRIARNHLPIGYTKTLPQLATANIESPGLTRVYDIALKIISHSDGRIDEDTLE